jgi:hypothetical protein
MNKQLFIMITIIECFYIYYMYNSFKTKISFHHPLEILIQTNSINNYIKHPINNGIYESKICKLGNHVSLVIIVYLLLRLYIIITSTENSRNNVINFNYFLFSGILIISFLMNFNAFLYLVPIYVYELYFYPILKID